MEKVIGRYDFDGSVSSNFQQIFHNIGPCKLNRIGYYSFLSNFWYFKEQITTIDLVFDFFKDPDDLPFRKGDVLIVVSKDEENWWTARNSHGQMGSIPVPYVSRVR